MDQCLKAVRLGITPLLERGQLPVICGFIGRSISGSITTLGRGGADTTAAILASCLGADQLVLLKDVGGVYTADPKAVDEASLIDFMGVDMASILTASGSRLLHDKVVKYKPDELDIRIVSESGSLSSGGTVVYGKLEDLVLRIDSVPVSKYTVVGRECTNPGVLPRLWSSIEETGAKIFSSHHSEKSLSFIAEGGATEVLKKINGTLGVELSAVASISNLALLTLQGTQLKQSRSILIQSLCELDYVQVNSDNTSLMLLIPLEKEEETLQILKKLMEEIGTGQT